MILWQAAVAFDVRTLKRAAPSCDKGNVGEIVVCGRADERRYRIDPLPPTGEGLGVAKRSIAGVRAGVGTEQATVGGFPSNRIMLTIKTPL